MDPVFLAMMALALTPAILIALYILYGLTMALLMLGGKLNAKLISGRLESVEKIIDSSYRHVYQNVLIKLEDGSGLSLKELKMATGLRQSGLLRIGGRFMMAVRPKGLKRGKVRLLAAANGRETVCLKKDLMRGYDLDWAQPVFLALAGMTLGFVFLMDPLAARGYESGFVAAALACGLVPAALLIVLYQLAARKFHHRVRQELEERTRGWAADSEAAPERGRAIAPLALNGDLEAAGLAAGAVSLGGVFFLLKWFALALTVFSSALARPKFEMRRFLIRSAGQAKRDASNVVFFKNAVLEDPFSRRKKTIKRFVPAANLINNGLIDEGLEGEWMVESGKLGHPSTEETIGALKAAACLTDDQLHLDLFDILTLYNYPPIIAPLAAALAGAFVGSLVIINRTSGSPGPLDFLWLIPATVLPVVIMTAARKRIIAAVQKPLQKKFTPAQTV